MTLWLWLMFLPAAIGLSTGSWPGCLGLAAAYIALFSTTSALVSLDAASAADIAAVVGRDDLVILSVSVACHGLLRQFRPPPPA